MKEFAQVQNEIGALVNKWESRLSGIEEDILDSRKNPQNRTIKQILGHLIDSASNNLHRTIHLQYQKSPIQFPDYANLGVNDTWIAVQNYQAETWPLLIQHWKYSNLHFIHVIGCIDETALGNIWISSLGEEVSLFDMIVDYPRHLKLHLSEIEELLAGDRPCAEMVSPVGLSRMSQSDGKQLDFYSAKLSYELDSWDLSELLKDNASVVVIDTRSREAYDTEHIPSAVSIPHRTMSFDATRHLDTSKTYITYCDGIGCNASTKGALKLTQLGFTTRELLGGLDWWKRDGHRTEAKEHTVVKDTHCGCS